MKQHNHKTPPKWAHRLLRWYCPYVLLEEIEGDLLESFEYNLKKKGLWQAKLFFVIDVIRFFNPTTFKKARSIQSQYLVHSVNYGLMFKSHLKSAIRGLLKNRFYSISNILGLSVSMACCLLMLLYLHNEWTYDQHNDQPKEIFRVVFDNYDAQGSFATTPLPIGPALNADFPEVEAMTRVASGFKSLVQVENNKFFERLAFIDTGFTEIFQLTMIKGNIQEVLAAPNQIIISSSYAEKYFGTADPIGRTIKIGSSGSLNSMVTGVYQDFPQNASVQFDIALPFSTFEKVWGVPSLWKQMPANQTFIRLRSDVEPIQLVAKLPAFAQRHVDDLVSNVEEEYKMDLQPLLDIHLSSEYGRSQNGGNVWVLYLLGVIALFVLIVAGINYVNYATANFTRRAKEVSIRKIIGASRWHLIWKFLGETLVLTVIAGGVAILLSELFLPAFNMVSGKNFHTADLHLPQFYAILAGIVLFTSLGAGIFPAIFLSGFRPSDTLRGKFAKQSIANFTRKGLVITQFTTSVILLTATIVVWQQMNFIRSSIRPDFGEQVAVMQINNAIAEKFDLLKAQISSQSGVISVSAGSNVATFTGDSWPVALDLNSPKIQTENYAIEDDFIQTMGYELIAGRSLSKANQSDVESGFVLNETAVKMLGFASPSAALEQNIIWGGSDLKKKGKVVGVIKDFYFQSMHDKVEPALLQFAPYDWMTSQFVAIRFEPSHLSTLKNTVSKTVQELDPSWHADLKFLDDNFLAIHEKDLQQGRIFGAFGGLAIFISCLGLFGLVAFATERRRKEIGIRKVLGATTSVIVGLLSKDFLKLVMIALLIGLPVGWLAMHKWLQNFAYQVDLQWWIFASVGLAAILIAGLTVSVKSIQAALANPVHALRDE